MLHVTSVSGPDRIFRSQHPPFEGSCLVLLRVVYHVFSYIHFLRTTGCRNTLAYLTHIHGVHNQIVRCLRRVLGTTSVTLLGDAAIHTLASPTIPFYRPSSESNNSQHCTPELTCEPRGRGCNILPQYSVTTLPLENSTYAHTPRYLLVLTYQIRGMCVPTTAPDVVDRQPAPGARRLEGSTLIGLGILSHDKVGLQLASTPVPGQLAPLRDHDQTKQQVRV